MKCLDTLCRPPSPPSPIEFPSPPQPGPGLIERGGEWRRFRVSALSSLYYTIHELPALPSTSNSTPKSNLSLSPLVRTFATIEHSWVHDVRNRRQTRTMVLHGRLICPKRREIISQIKFIFLRDRQFDLCFPDPSKLQSFLSPAKEIQRTFSLPIDVFSSSGWYRYIQRTTHKPNYNPQAL